MEKRIINLDECVINALTLFSSTQIPNIKLKFKKPLIIGSGNAAVTGKVLFSDHDCIFANESNYMEKLKTQKIDGCILISASGGKHSPIIANEMKKRKIKTILITNNNLSKASQFCNETFVFPKNIEPYTYNTSTYLGMILGKTQENPKKILKLIETTKIPNLKKYKSFFIILPEKFDSLKEMFQTKFDELFGPMIQGRIFTYEQTKHAKTIIDYENELFIGLGVKNKIFGKNRLNLEIPNDSKEVTILALGYYIIGKIQEQNKPYFRENIEGYVKKISKVFGEKINVFS